MHTRVYKLFIVAAVLALLAGSFYGLLATFHFILPGKITAGPAFQQLKPLHLQLVISWIVLAATGGIYYYLRDGISAGKSLMHFLLWLIAGLGIITAYLNNWYEGRKYFEFPVIFAIFLVAGWFLFGLNVWRVLFRRLKHQPVYFWMWGLGIIFFIISMVENYLWLIPWFNENIVRDLTVQWKGMGSMVGAWNLLVYGTAIYVMHNISKEDGIAGSKIAFALFFLGLTNLMFNWGHHTYIIPAKFWVREIAYFISMTELIILGKIIYDWRKKLLKKEGSTSAKDNIAVKFMSAADIWILLNLVQAILMSIPAINIYTHGTHVTVAHAMGTTIGINTMILFSSIFYIKSIENPEWRGKLSVKAGFHVLNYSLLIFWLSLTVAGIMKGYLTYHSDFTFREIMEKIYPYLFSFLISGIGVFMGIVFVGIPVLFNLLPAVVRRFARYPIRR